MKDLVFGAINNQLLTLVEKYGVVGQIANISWHVLPPAVLAAIALFAMFLIGLAVGQKRPNGIQSAHGANANANANAKPTFVLGVPLLSIMFDPRTHIANRENLIRVGVNANFVGTIENVQLEVIGATPLSTRAEVVKAAADLARRTERKLWGGGNMRDGKEVKFDILESFHSDDKFLICYTPDHATMPKGDYRLRLRASGTVHISRDHLTCEADVDVGMKRRRMYLKMVT